MTRNSKQDALQIFNAAVESVKPARLMQQHLQLSNENIKIGQHTIELAGIGKLLVIAAGKAAAAMAEEAEKQLGEIITGGICVTKYEHGRSLKKIKLIEAGHPVLDENSLLAGTEIESLLKDVSARDVVLVLLSGGASALMESLPKGILLADLQKVMNSLMRCGASIHEINTIRKHISKLKGGGLATAAFPAQVHTLVLSDVVGDDLDVIASGPTVVDTSTFEDAAFVLHKYSLWEDLPASIKSHLQKGLREEIPETPKAGNNIFERCFTTIIGSNKIALLAAVNEATLLGYHTTIFKENATDNTGHLAKELINSARGYAGNLPACFLIGGETTLEVSGDGKGGRNQHFVLCALDEMLASSNVGFEKDMIVLSAGTDGTDGPTDATGAIADYKVFNQIPNITADLKKSLAQFDAYHFFEKHGGLIKTGATQTNVMDIMMVTIA